MKKVTIRDVASHAGVSYQTVSRVINNHPDVAEQTREHVLQIVRDLDYHPNATARNLVTRKPNTFGLIAGDFGEYFFTQVIIGAEREARKNDFFFMLGITESKPQDEPEYFRMMAEQPVAGILFARPSPKLWPDNQHIEDLLDRGMPLVTVAYHNLTGSHIVVDVDNIQGGLLATRCLVEAGHRRIGMITGMPGWQAAGDRALGYRKALEEAQIPHVPDLIEPGDWSYRSGDLAAQRLLRRIPDLTALFVQSDQMAIGAMAALRTAGYSIPEDIAVMGYDDLPVAQYAYPALSTIRQPMQELGQLAASLLIDATKNPASGKKTVLLQPELIRRDSCGTRPPP